MGTVVRKNEKDEIQGKMNKYNTKTKVTKTEIKIGNA